MVKKQSESYTITRHDLLDKLGISCKRIVDIKKTDILYPELDEPMIILEVEVDGEEE